MSVGSGSHQEGNPYKKEPSLQSPVEVGAGGVVGLVGVVAVDDFVGGAGVDVLGGAEDAVGLQWYKSSSQKQSLGH